VEERGLQLHASSASALGEGVWPVSHAWISLDNDTAFNPLKTKLFCFMCKDSVLTAR
jgi:hypothetical protein